MQERTQNVVASCAFIVPRNSRIATRSRVILLQLYFPPVLCVCLCVCRRCSGIPEEDFRALADVTAHTFMPKFEDIRLKVGPSVVPCSCRLSEIVENAVTVVPEQAICITYYV